MVKVLIVDDAKFLRMTLRTILEKANFEVIAEATNGQEAIELYKEHQPDIVIMDITMPLMNGIDAVKEIIDFDPDAKIVMCSAVGQEKVIVKAIELGAKDFIVKPFVDANIIDTVNRLV